jgi:hypothetical protein
MTNVGLNMQCAYISDVEEILLFKTFKGFQKQVACETDNNKNISLPLPGIESLSSNP